MVLAGRLRTRGVFPLSLPLLAAFALPLLAASPARADFRVCNATQNLVGVGIGYRAKAGWITEEDLAGDDLASEAEEDAEGDASEAAGV